MTNLITIEYGLSNKLFALYYVSRIQMLSKESTGPIRVPDIKSISLRGYCFKNVQLIWLPEEFSLK